jgi:hypothetical protein
MQVGRGVVYVSAAGRPGRFSAELASAMNLLEPAPNPLRLIYNNVLKLEVGEHISRHFPYLELNVKLETGGQTLLSLTPVGLPSLDGFMPGVVASCKLDQKGFKVHKRFLY